MLYKSAHNRRPQPHVTHTPPKRSEQLIEVELRAPSIVLLGFPCGSWLPPLCLPNSGGCAPLRCTKVDQKKKN